MCMFVVTHRAGRDTREARPVRLRFRSASGCGAPAQAGRWRRVLAYTPCLIVPDEDEDATVCEGNGKQARRNWAYTPRVSAIKPSALGSCAGDDDARTRSDVVVMKELGEEKRSVLDAWPYYLAVSQPQGRRLEEYDRLV